MVSENQKNVLVKRRSLPVKFYEKLWVVGGVARHQKHVSVTGQKTIYKAWYFCAAVAVVVYMQIRGKIKSHNLYYTANRSDAINLEFNYILIQIRYNTYNGKHETHLSRTHIQVRTRK